MDSDVLIEVLRGRKPEILQQWHDLALSSEAVYYSPVSAAEVGHGMRERERLAVERLFAALTCMPIDEEIGRRAGKFLQAFHASHGLELGDALIAATAAVYELMLWTQNRKHFPMKEVRFFVEH